MAVLASCTVQAERRAGAHCAPYIYIYISRKIYTMKNENALIPQPFLDWYDIWPGQAGRDEHTVEVGWKPRLRVFA